MPPNPSPICSVPTPAETLFFEGIPIVVDPSIPPGRMLLVNPTSLRAEIQVEQNETHRRPPMFAVNPKERDAILDGLAKSGMMFGPASPRPAAPNLLYSVTQRSNTFGPWMDPPVPTLIEMPELLRALVPGMTPNPLLAMVDDQMDALSASMSQSMQAAMWQANRDPNKLGPSKPPSSGLMRRAADWIADLAQKKKGLYHPTLEEQAEFAKLEPGKLLELKTKGPVDWRQATKLLTD